MISSQNLRPTARHSQNRAGQARRAVRGSWLTRRGRRAHVLRVIIGRMRIAVDARALGRPGHGVARYLQGLLTAWLDAFPADSFVLLSPKEVHLPPALAGRVEVRTSSGMPGTLWLQTLASPTADREGADLFFGPLGVLPLRSRLPLVATVHDLTPLLHPEWHPLKNRLGFNPFIGPTVRKARRIAAVSEATRRDLVTLFAEAEKKCRVIPNGVSVPEIRDTGELPNGGRPYVLYLGTMEPRKNVPRLIRALESLWDRRPDFPDLLLAGGPGWGLLGLERSLSSSRHASRIRRVGLVGETEAARLMKHARLLAYPSLYEGFGLPPLEAMALGTVVVGSSSSSLPEVIGDAGLLPDPTSETAIAAALEKAEGDERWRREARERGLARARQFTWERAARATRDLFAEAVA